MESPHKLLRQSSFAIRRKVPEPEGHGNDDLLKVDVSGCCAKKTLLIPTAKGVKDTADTRESKVLKNWASTCVSNVRLSDNVVWVNPLE